MSDTLTVIGGGVTVSKKVTSASVKNTVVTVSVYLQGTCDVNVLVVIDGL